MDQFQTPIPFHVSAKSQSGIATPWIAEASAHPTPLTVSIPREFGGSAPGFSPEDLFALALENCFVATFKVFAERSNLGFELISVNATLEVDRLPEGGLGMARILFGITLDGASNADLAHRVLEKTSRGCMILNSVKTEKVFQFTVA